MKLIKTAILSLGIVCMLFGCDSKEKLQLRSKVDSLSNELIASKKVEKTMDEIGAMIDSIDISRRVLNTKVVEGTSYSDYVMRLKDINNNINSTQKKLEEMEQSLKHSNRVSAATIKRLKADLEQRSKEIVELQIDVAKAREENKALAANIVRKDSVISTKEDMIKVKEADITSLQGLVKDVNEQNKQKVAGLYFAQAQALELAADRTKFAPRKKKETRREALELYRLSMSMGNTEAQEKIDKLEKQLG